MSHEDAPPKAPVRRALFQVKRAVSKKTREEDALDGCSLDFTENPTSDDELDALLEPPEYPDAV